MQIKKTITTRELLRNFKSCKEMLNLGRVECFVIPMERGKNIEIRATKEPATAKRIAQFFRNLPKPIHIERPRLFSEFIRKR